MQTDMKKLLLIIMCLMTLTSLSAQKSKTFELKGKPGAVYEGYASGKKPNGHGTLTITNSDSETKYTYIIEGDFSKEGIISNATITFVNQKVVFKGNLTYKTKRVIPLTPIIDTISSLINWCNMWESDRDLKLYLTDGGFYSNDLLVASLKGDSMYISIPIGYSTKISSYEVPAYVYGSVTNNELNLAQKFACSKNFTVTGGIESTISMQKTGLALGKSSNNVKLEFDNGATFSKSGNIAKFERPNGDLIVVNNGKVSSYKIANNGNYITENGVHYKFTTGDEYDGKVGHLSGLTLKELCTFKDAALRYDMLDMYELNGKLTLKNGGYLDIKDNSVVSGNVNRTLANGDKYSGTIGGNRIKATIPLANYLSTTIPTNDFLKYVDEGTLTLADGSAHKYTHGMPEEEYNAYIAKYNELKASDFLKADYYNVPESFQITFKDLAQMFYDKTRNSDQLYIKYPNGDILYYIDSFMNAPTYEYFNSLGYAPNIYSKDEYGRRVFASDKLEITCTKSSVGVQAYNEDTKTMTVYDSEGKLQKFSQTYTSGDLKSIDTYNNKVVFADGSYFEGTFSFEVLDEAGNKLNHDERVKAFGAKLGAGPEHVLRVNLYSGNVYNKSKTLIKIYENGKLLSDSEFKSRLEQIEREKREAAEEARRAAQFKAKQDRVYKKLVAAYPSYKKEISDLVYDGYLDVWNRSWPIGFFKAMFPGWISDSDFSRKDFGVFGKGYECIISNMVNGEYVYVGALKILNDRKTVILFVSGWHYDEYIRNGAWINLHK